MTPVTRKMKTAKGCEYCTNRITKVDGNCNAPRTFCPYNACIYHELDNCETYEEYFSKEIPLSPEVNALLAMFRESNEPLKRGKFLPR